jgi:hypothetical protein
LRAGVLPEADLARSPLFRVRGDIEFLGLPLKLFGKLDELSSRRIVPR